MKRMKNVLTLLLLTTIAVAQNTSDAPPTPAAPSTNSAIPTDQENSAKAKQLIQQAIQTLGGQSYLTWRTQTSQGRSYSFHHGEPNSLGTQVWRFREYPDKDRLAARFELFQSHAD